MREFVHYPLGVCQSCGHHFRLLADGTIRMHAIGGGVRCDGARLPPASTYSPILDPIEDRPTDEGADTAP